VAIQTPTNPSVSDQDLQQVTHFFFASMLADIKLLSKHKQTIAEHQIPNWLNASCATSNCFDLLGALLF
jgi:hypothetical protein